MTSQLMVCNTRNNEFTDKRFSKSRLIAGDKDVNVCKRDKVLRNLSNVLF